MNSKALSFDRGAMLENLAGMEDIVMGMIEALEGFLPRLIGTIEEAAVTRDVKAMEMAAHTLKGTLGNFYARRAVEMAAAMERSARAGDVVAAAEIWLDLKPELDRLRTDLHEAFPAAA